MGFAKANKHLIMKSVVILRVMLFLTNITWCYITPRNLILFQAYFLQIFHTFFNSSLTVAHGKENYLLSSLFTAEVPLQLVTENGYVKSKNLLIFDDVIWQNKFRPDNKLLIITQNNETSYFEMLLSTVWVSSRIADVVIASINTSVEFFTFFPYKTCQHSTIPVQITINNLYPKKFNGDLHGCELRYVTDWLMPYVRGSEAGDAGIENLLFNEIVKKLNGTPKAIALPAGETAQNSQNAKGELAGGAKKLNLQEADILYSGFTYREHLIDIIDVVTPHTIDYLAWVVPSAVPLEGPMYLRLAFTWQVWLALLIVLFWMIIAHFLHKSLNILTDVTALTLNLAISKPISKLFYIFSFFYSLHITTMYQASLFNLFSQNIFVQPISTIEEAADANLVSYFFNYHKSLLNLSDFTLWKKILARTNFKDRHNPADFVEGRQFLCLVQVNPVNYYVELRHIYDEYGPAIYQIPQKFLMYPVVFYLSRGNPLTSSIDGVTQRLVEGGFVSHWLTRFQAKLLKRNKNLTGKVALGMFHLSGAFGIWMLSLIITIVIFIVELVINKIHTKKLSSKNQGPVRW